MATGYRKVQELAEEAIKSLARNQDCFVAQWILQNPDENIGDYTFTAVQDWRNSSWQYSITKVVAD